MEVEQDVRYEDLPDVLYVNDVARFLRMSPRSVRYYISIGALRHERLGGRIVVPKRYLKTFGGVGS